MIAKPFDLVDSIVTTYGDTTKTFKTSKINTKTIGGDLCIGPNLNKWFPVFDDTGVSPFSVYVSPNGRVFTIGTITSGLGRVTLYDFNFNTGVLSFVGSLNMQFINSPATTHTIRAFKVYDGASAGVVTGWRIFVATTGSVTANGGPYMAMSIAKTDFTAVPVTIPTATGTDQKQVYKLENSVFTLTQSAGFVLDRASSVLWLQNGVSATYQFAKFDFSLSTGAPAANGIITTLTSFLTGNLPALTGTLLLTNSAKYAVPTASPNPAGLLGLPCAFFTTGTNAYMGLLSELTNGGTTWPSLQASNFITPLLFINPTPTTGTWSNSIDRAVFNGGVGALFIKPLASNTIDSFFGGVDSQFLESGGYLTHETLSFGGITTTQIDAEGGWIFLVSTATSQRGIVSMNIESDHNYGMQYVITKVVDTNSPQFYETICFLRKLLDKTLPPIIQYRTSGFASQTAGWTSLTSFDLTSVATGAQVQFRILFDLYSQGLTNSAQIQESHILYQSNSELSENWRISKNQSSESFVVFYLYKTYPATVPTLYFRAFDVVVPPVTETILYNYNSVTNAAQFTYSTDLGVSYLPLGTIPNVAGTRVKVTMSPAPTVAIQPSLRES